MERILLCCILTLIYSIFLGLGLSNSEADDFKCPKFTQGTYPNKFQIAGNNSSLWTLDIGNNSFVTISRGITWTQHQVSRKEDAIPKLICIGYVNGSNQLIRVYYPLYFSSYWTCIADGYGERFTCNIK